MGDTAERIVEIARSVVGTTVRLDLPALVGSSRTEYRFAFEVVDVGARGFRDHF